MRKLGHACTALETAIQFSANFLTMIAIITCAGRGTRRRPDTEHTPKILLEHAGQPLIDHIVRPIDESGLFDKIVFVLSLQHGQKVIDHVHRSFLDTPVKFVWQDAPLGFGHAVLQAREEVFTPLRFPPLAGRLRGGWNPPVLIHTDDAVNRHCVDGMSLVSAITSKKESQIGVQWRGNVKNYGMAIVSYPNGHLPRTNSPMPGRVDRLVEKPYWDEGGLAMTGIYYIRESRRLFRCLNKLVNSGRCLGGEYQFTHALQMMIDQGTPFQTYYHEWVDCGQARKREDEGTEKREI